MGREIRRVPKDWEHPQYDVCPHMRGLAGHQTDDPMWSYHNGKCFKPLYDESYREAIARYIEEVRDYWRRYEAGDIDSSLENWCGAPDPAYCRPDWSAESMTCYQIYETVSEGTPISPVFETADQVVAWLVKAGYLEEAAGRFVRDGWAPSFVVVRNAGSMQMGDGIEAAEWLHDAD